MGVRFGREYADIIKDLGEAMEQIRGCCELLGMSEEEWAGLEGREKMELIRTLADDIFYALGTNPKLEVGDSTFVYDAKNHIIRISEGEKIVHIIYLT